LRQIRLNSPVVLSRWLEPCVVDQHRLKGTGSPDGLSYGWHVRVHWIGIDLKKRRGWFWNFL
jgi:hypothetical protein